MTIGQVCAKYGTHLKLGLDEAEAEARLARNGFNSFTPPKEKKWYILFLKEISGGFSLLLWFAAIASVVAYFLQNNKNYQNVRFLKLIFNEKQKLINIIIT